MRREPAALTAQPGHDPAAPVPFASGVVVITRVRGSLCCARTGALAEAREAVATLASYGVPVVLASDYSASQLLWLQHELGIRQPFVCEGGAALYVPGGYFDDRAIGSRSDDWEIIEFAAPRAQVSACLHQCAASLPVAVRGWSGMTAEELSAQLSGQHVALAEAERLLDRHYDEPFEFDGAPADRTRLFARMRAAGYRCFVTAHGCHATAVRHPGHAMHLLLSLYRARFTPLVIGLGDDWPDRLLLRAVDVPVVVRNEALDQRRLLRELPAAYVTAAEGPAGWAEAVLGSVAA